MNKKEIIRLAKKLGYDYIKNEINENGMFFSVKGYYDYFVSVEIDDNNNIIFEYTVSNQGHEEYNENIHNITDKLLTKKLSNIISTKDEP